MTTFLPHNSFRRQALSSLFQMGKVPRVAELDGGEAGWSPLHLDPGLLSSLLCHTVFSEEHLLWRRCPMQGTQWAKRGRTHPSKSAWERGAPAALPNVSLSQSQQELSPFLFCPLSSPEAQPEAHCQGFSSSENDLHFHLSRKFCLWTFLNVIFNGYIWSTLNLLHIQHKSH